MPTSNEHEQQIQAGAELVPAGLACLRQLGDQAEDAPRVVTTGRKTTTSPDGEDPAPCVDDETGEPVKLYATGVHGIKAVRHLVPDGEASPSVAQIDTLAFTVVPSNEGGRTGSLLRCGGSSRSKASSSAAGASASPSRCGSVTVRACVPGAARAKRTVSTSASRAKAARWSPTGLPCRPALSAWLEAHRTAIKRVDVAYDDLAGETVNIEWAVDQYAKGGFKAGGRNPSHQLFGDWLSGSSAARGRTLGIGSRDSGKYCRIYEKGKQLGDPESRWTRIEVEWRGQDRLIPYDVLTRPGQYLAGAYPCLRSLSVQQSRIKTIAKAGTIAYERAVATGRLHTGKLVNLMLHVMGGDYAAVVDRLKRAGTPARIDPFSYHLRGAPEKLDPDSPGSFASILNRE